MIHDPADQPPRLAALLYGPADDADVLLADFALDLVQRGVRVGGIAQRNLRDAAGKKSDMEVIDLADGHAISICLQLGPGSTACKLDTAGLAEAAVSVQQAIRAGVDLIVVNKFAKQEAEGAGLRNELADAIMSGIPVLTAVPQKCLDDWTAFTGGTGVTLPASREALEAWWRETAKALQT